jgi:hypothetical protein
MEDLIMWLYSDGDFLLFLCRMFMLIFALQFVTGITYVIRGGYNGIS